jgi:hypothetical protein
VRAGPRRLTCPAAAPADCRGVFWDKKTRRWRCQLGYQSKKIFLGYFDTAQDAAKAYDRKLVELRGASGGSRPGGRRPSAFLTPLGGKQRCRSGR